MVCGGCKKAEIVYVKPASAITLCADRHAQQTSLWWAAPKCSKPAPGSLLVQLGRQQVAHSGVRVTLVLLAGPKLLVQLSHCSLWGDSGWQQVWALCT